MSTTNLPAQRNRNLPVYVGSQQAIAALRAGREVVLSATTLGDGTPAMRVELLAARVQQDVLPLVEVQPIRQYRPAPGQAKRGRLQTWHKVSIAAAIAAAIVGCAGYAVVTFLRAVRDAGHATGAAAGAATGEHGSGAGLMVVGAIAVVVFLILVGGAKACKTIITIEHKH